MKILNNDYPKFGVINKKVSQLNLLDAIMF